MLTFFGAMNFWRDFRLAKMWTIFEIIFMGNEKMTNQHLILDHTFNFKGERVILWTMGIGGGDWQWAEDIYSRHYF